MDLIPDKSIDFILTDPPFFTTKADWDKNIDLSLMWIQFKRIIKDNGCIAIFAQIPFSIKLGASNLEMLRYEWIWEKTSATGHLNAKKMPMKSHECVQIYYSKLPTYNPQKTTGHKRKVSTAKHKRNSKETELYGKHEKTSYDSTDRFPRDVLKFKTDKQTNSLFSTQKPLALCKYFIETYTNEGETVLDCFSGSGTTLLAAKELNRNFIGIENNEKNYKISKERIGL